MSFVFKQVPLREENTNITSTMNPIEVLKAACKTGETFILSKLVDAGVFHKRIDIENNLSPLMYAIKNGTSEVVELLLAEGVNVNEKSRDCGEDKTPLILAIQSNQLEKVRLLLKYGADITLKDYLDQSALHYVLNQALGSSIADYDIDLHKEQLNAVLHYGVRSIGISKLADRHRRFCQLFQAVIAEDQDTVRQLLRTINHIEVHRVEKLNTPLSYAINHCLFNIIDIYLEFEPQYVFFTSIKLHNFAVIKHLVCNHDIDINMKDDLGKTALHLSEEKTSWLILFLQYGADPAIRSQASLLPTFSYSTELMQHFNKLNMIDSQFVDKQLSIIFRSFPSKSSLIKENTDNQYTNELEILKTVRISQSTPSNAAINLYDYLFLRPNEVVRFSENENLSKLYLENDKDFSNKYPHYGFAINYQFHRALGRMKLMEGAGNFLFSAMGSNFHINIMYEIFQYFSANSLKKFIA